MARRCRQESRRGSETVEGGSPPPATSGVNKVHVNGVKHRQSGLFVVLIGPKMSISTTALQMNDAAGHQFIHQLVSWAAAVGVNPNHRHAIRAALHPVIKA